MKNILIIGVLLSGIAFASTGHHGKHPLVQASSKEDGKSNIKLTYAGIRDGKVFVKLKNLKGEGIKQSDLQTSHTKKVHIFIISDNLEYYRHIHPKAEGEIGLYSFEWNEFDKTRNYRIWADVIHAKTGKQEYLSFRMKGFNQEPIQETKNMSFTASNGMNFKISFDKRVKSDTDLTMKFTVSDKTGKPFHGLEPVMGAFAHAVGFSGGSENIIHTHPLGDEVMEGKGGPDLFFHINFSKKGYTKLWLQVKIEGKDYFLPFGVEVK